MDYKMFFKVFRKHGIVKIKNLEYIQFIRLLIKVRWKKENILRVKKYCFIN